MKPQTSLLLFFAVLTALLLPDTITAQQQYKLKQRSGTMGMNTETTIYVKGMRKRTEGGSFMGQPSLVTIEQCDK